MEKTIFSFQSPKTRLQIIVKNNNLYVIKNRKKMKTNYYYMKDFPEQLKIMRTFLNVVNTEVLNETINYFASVRDTGESINAPDYEKK